MVKRCKSFGAKSLDSCNSCRSDVGVFKIASSQPESDTFFLERESLDVGTCASASDSSSIAISKLATSYGIAQDNSCGKGASHFFSKLKLLNQSFIAHFFKKDRHTAKFWFPVPNMSNMVVIHGAN